MQITLEMNSLRKDNYILQLKVKDLLNIHETQLEYLRLDNEKLNTKQKNIHCFYQTILNDFKFARKKVELMRQINKIYESRLKNL